MELILIRGLPGSGRTTLAKGRFFDYEIYEANDYFVTKEGNYEFDGSKLNEAHAQCIARTREALSLGKNVVVTNTFVTLKEMEPYVTMATQFKADLKVYECYGEYKSPHNVPESTIKHMRDKWERIY